MHVCVCVYMSRRKSNGVSLTAQKFRFTINSFLKEIGQRVSARATDAGELTPAPITAINSRTIANTVKVESSRRAPVGEVSSKFVV